MIRISETLEMVFAAFMQMYTDTQCTVYMPLSPARGRVPFKKPPILLVLQFTTMQSEEAALF